MCIYKSGNTSDSTNAIIQPDYDTPIRYDTRSLIMLLLD